jgi:signal transduction histidine kinase/ActR/RegA family two-component response regulator
MKLNQESLSQFSISLLQQNELSGLMREFARQIGLLLNYEDALIYLANGDSEFLQVSAIGPKNLGENWVANPVRIHAGDRIAGSVAASGKAEIVSDTQNDSRYVPDGFDGRSEIAVPIIFEDRVIGVVDCESKNPGNFSQTDIDDLTLLVSIAAPRIANARQIQDQLRSQSRQLESFSIFMGGIAHDFNNHLQAIMASLAATEPIASDTVLQFLKIAEQACEKSKGLTDQLLSFAKKSATQMAATDLEVLVQESAQLALTTRKSNYEIEVNGILPLAQADRSQIEQVVSNLLINADQASPEGGLIKIRLSKENMPDSPTTESVLIQIQDFGSGIPETDLEEIFHPHFTTKPDGNGLGLAISNFVVQRHGGKLLVASQEGEGSTFSMYLPLSVTNAAIVAADSDTCPTKIMLVDDESSVRQGVSAYLNSLGYTAVVAASANEAICQFSEAFESNNPIAAAIIDLNIPNSNGIAILKELRKIDPNIPAILTSGFGATPLENYQADHGFSGILPKPFNLKMLRHELSCALTPEPETSG